MARITVEKCLKKIPNRYDLMHVAARRAHELLAGGMPLVDNAEKDSAIVTALREIEAGRVTIDILENADSGSINYENTFSDLANQAEHVVLTNNFEEEDEEGTEGTDGTGIEASDKAGAGAAPEAGAETNMANIEGDNVAENTMRAAATDEVSAEVSIDAGALAKTADELAKTAGALAETADELAKTAGASAEAATQDAPTPKAASTEDVAATDEQVSGEKNES
jgi:DNA-directed RNA polymerase subunit omega